MRSAHEYTAVAVVGSDEYPVHISRSGRITLDESDAPHVQADIELSVADEATLTLLDPRLGARIQITADAQFPAGSQHREFDLALRSRPVRHGRSASVSVKAASDEALLDDKRAPADDPTPRTHQASLRAVVDYVLNKVIPGAALEASPAGDADVTAYWSVTNVIPNPTGQVNASNWAAGTGASGIGAVTMSTPLPPIGNRAITWTAAAGDSNGVPTTTNTAYRVTPGKKYVFATYIATGTTPRNARAAIQWWGDSGNVIVKVDNGANVLSDAVSFKRIYVIAVAPPGAQYALPYINTQGNSAGQSHFAALAMFYEGEELIPAFLGSTAPGGGYTYAWQGAAHASPSTRTPVVERPPEALIWRAGDSAIDFLHPLVQANGFRLVCDEARAWTLRDEQYNAGLDVLSIRDGVNLLNGEDVIDLDAGLWFDAQATIYQNPDRTVPDVVDYYEMTTPPVRVNRVVVNAAYPGPGRSEYAVRRAQGRGREVTATMVADWRTKAEQTAQIVLENAPLQIGETSRVTFDLGTDEMTVTTRTTDIQPSAWSLIPTGEAWNESPVGEAWNEEVI